ncbi:uncharacterized protein LOC127158194 [Labeo rohita]|uniref:uncharacterized protein LOC127158194 n=1 Tax=Labeo rohita TaxID=84645 RepID=UPI0021E2F761|nr:uncharacterized protein LOC127158194 [Labeo rohita]
MFNYFSLLLLLLFCFVYHSEIFPAGNPPISVRGQRGGSITLPCEFKACEISDISLNSLSENIPVCQTEECSERVLKLGNCDIFIKDLSFSDAGTYILHVYYHNEQAELERQTRTYQLHIHDEISVEIGKQLKLDILLPNADKVEHQTERSTGWMAVWSRSNAVWSDRLTNRDGNLIITKFAASDAGTYIVLDSEGELLITLTVKASGSDRKHKAPRLPDPGLWSLSMKLTVFFVIWGILVILLFPIMYLAARFFEPISAAFGYLN